MSGLSTANGRRLLQPIVQQAMGQLVPALDRDPAMLIDGQGVLIRFNGHQGDQARHSRLYRKLKLGGVGINGDGTAQPTGVRRIVAAVRSGPATLDVFKTCGGK